MPIVKGNGNGGNRNIVVDMTNVEDRVLLEEGSYLAEVKAVEQKMSQNGNPMLVWQFKIYDQENNRTAVVFYNTSLQPQALFNLRNLLISLGAEVPAGKMELCLDDYIGAQCIAKIGIDNYNNKDRNKIEDFAPYTD